LLQPDARSISANIPEKISLVVLREHLELRRVAHRLGKAEVAERV
jgi:hypothetical protein